MELINELIFLINAVKKFVGPVHAENRITIFVCFSLLDLICIFTTSPFLMIVCKQVDLMIIFIPNINSNKFITLVNKLVNNFVRKNLKVVLKSKRSSFNNKIKVKKPFVNKFRY